MNYLFSFLNLHQKMDELNYNQRRYINVINVNNGMPKDGKSVIMQMRQEIDQYKDQFHKISRELKIQEGKNADLRSKNWKAMEALNNVERLYQKSLKTPGNPKRQYTPAMDRMGHYRKQLQIQTEAEEAQKSFLLQLFGDFLQINDAQINTRAHKDWLENFASQVITWKKDYKQLKRATLDGNYLKDNEMVVLRNQLKQYEDELRKSKTELHGLYSTMEMKEFQWKKQLEEKEMEVERIRLKVICAVEKAEKSINELEEKLSNEQSEQKQMENKNLILHEKLSDEESKRKKTSKKLSNLKERHELERNNLRSEIMSIRNCLETENLHRQYLEDRILQMDQTVFLGQKTLKEKDDTIDKLKQQVEELERILTLKAQISSNEKASQTESFEVLKDEDVKKCKNIIFQTQKQPCYKNKNKKKKKKKLKHVF